MVTFLICGQLKPFDVKLELFLRPAEPGIHLPSLYCAELFISKEKKLMKGGFPLSLILVPLIALASVN